jgi:NHLM bacteriocin system ABC transporter peptidase/ATP-binding protein
LSAAALSEAPPAARRRRRQRRRPVPTVLQMEAVECGAASLAMILAHHGRWVPLEELRVACGVSRDGTKASNLLKAARRYGLVAKGLRKEADRLDELPWPVVLYWNFNHFLVLEGIDGDRVHLNDPATGRRRVDARELDEAFTGVALAFEPGPGFERGGRPPSMLPLLRERLAGSRTALAYVLLASLLLVIPGVALPAFSRAFVDDVLVGGQGDWLVPLLLGMGFTALVRAGVTWLQQHALVGLEAKLSVVPTSRFLWHLLRLPVAFFAQRHPGELLNRAAANDRVARLLSGDLATSVLNALTVAFFGVAMLLYDALLGACAMALALLNVVAIRWGAVVQAQGARRELTEEGRLQAVTVGAIQAIETVKASSLEDSTFERWSGHQARLLAIRRELGLQSALLAAAPPLLQSLSAATVLGLGGWRVMEGAMTLGTLVAFQSLAASFAQPIGRLVALGTTIQTVRADLRRVQDVMGTAAEPRVEAPPAAGDDALRPLSGLVELRGLTFGYSPLDPPLIEDLSVTLRPGTRVAFVGASGSGKSTVGRLVAGLLAPWSGEILLDGRPAAEVPAPVRARSLAYVDQELFLFEGTVRENLTLWDPTVPEADVTRALADAAILDDVAARPGQADTPVAEGGANFSGGQRQRLEIARALVRDPAVLILDEATAALDPATEKEIDDNLRRRGCTCIIIAHRLSTIRDCDEILVLRGGRVVERGPHEALMARGGEYAALIASG